MRASFPAARGFYTTPDIGRFAIAKRETLLVMSADRAAAVQTSEVKIPAIKFATSSILLNEPARLTLRRPSPTGTLPAEARPVSVIVSRPGHEGSRCCAGFCCDGLLLLAELSSMARGNLLKDQVFDGARKAFEAIDTRAATRYVGEGSTRSARKRHGDSLDPTNPSRIPCDASSVKLRTLQASSLWYRC